MKRQPKHFAAIALCLLTACAAPPKQPTPAAEEHRPDPMKPRPDAITPDMATWLKYICEDLRDFPEEQERAQKELQEKHGITIAACADLKTNNK
jgi:hypothetical protein